MDESTSCSTFITTIKKNCSGPRNKLTLPVMRSKFETTINRYGPVVFVVILMAISIYVFFVLLTSSLLIIYIVLYNLILDSPEAHCSTD